MKRRVLILEDLEVSRKSLVEMVRECSDELVIYDYGNPAEALECAMKQDIDLFLVDIILKPKEHNDFSGVWFAKTIRECSRYAAAEIVFVTTLAGLEPELLRMVHCFDYIEKPITKERVQKVVGDALNKLNGKRPEREMVFLRKDKITYPVYTDLIVYAESRRKILHIHTEKEIIDVPNFPLNQFLESVHTQKFLYAAKGVAVNVAYIEFVDATNRYIKLRGITDMISIGTNMKVPFLKEFHEIGGRDGL